MIPTPTDLVDHAIRFIANYRDQAIDSLVPCNPDEIYREKMRKYTTEGFWFSLGYVNRKRVVHAACVFYGDTLPEKKK